MIKGISNNNATLNFSTISSKKIKPDEVEKSKVDEIKESIKNGTYKIDIDNSAKKLAKSLL